MDYKKFEAKIRTACELPYARVTKGGNVCTPHVLGFLPIYKNITAEISYGDIMGEHYVGFTAFENGRIMDLPKRSKYSNCFHKTELDDILPYAEKIKELLIESETKEQEMNEIKTNDESEEQQYGIRKRSIRSTET